MTSAMRSLLGCLVLCAAVCVVVSQSSSLSESSASRIKLETNEVDSNSLDSNDSEESKDDSEGGGSPGAISTIFSNIFQLPMRLFRAFNSLVSSAPLARLREEMQNLNISYPKNN